MSSLDDDLFDSLPSCDLPQAAQAPQEPQASQAHTRGDVGKPVEPARLVELVELASLAKLVASHVEACKVDDPKVDHEKKLFDLARRLKGVKPELTHQQHMDAVEAWARASSPWVDVSYLVAWQLKYEEKLGTVKQAHGDVMAAIVAKSKLIPDETVAGLPKGCNDLLRLCIALDEHHAGMSWPLSDRLAGEVIGLSHTMASTLLKHLRKLGKIELTREHRMEGGRRMASEYRLVRPTEVNSQANAPNRQDDFGFEW